MPTKDQEIDLCISALTALKVSREAYASSERHVEFRKAVADALELNGTAMSSTLCDAVSDAIRHHG